MVGCLWCPLGNRATEIARVWVLPVEVAGIHGTRAYHLDGRKTGMNGDK